MKYLARAGFLLLMCVLFIKTQAQQNHFIYIECENQEPFAVVMNGKVFSSSDYGYVILPKLTDGDYAFTVSFPLNKYPDQQFTCTISKKDLGFTLHNNGDKSWALQNMLTQKNLAAKNNAPVDNAFNNMLSQAVDDSTIATKNTVHAIQKTDTISVQKTDTPVANVATANTTITQKNTGSISEPLQKIAQLTQDTGTNMVFVDNSVAGKDTIRVFVPANATTGNTTTIQNNAPVTADNASPANENLPASIDTTQHATGNPFYKPGSTFNYNIQPANNNNFSSSKVTNAVKTDCSSMIAENDVEKIKRKMFVQKNDNNSVQTALKMLNGKCLTTEQVKDLGSIFSTDDGRYNLYDALYKSVYDYGNYINLDTQIIDPYYKKRFETMLR